MTPHTEFILASKYFIASLFSAMGVFLAEAIPVIPEWAIQAGAGGLLVVFLTYAVIHLWRANQTLHKKMQQEAHDREKRSNEREKRSEEVIGKLTSALNRLKD